jgi:hypothetical protein
MLLVLRLITRIQLYCQAPRTPNCWTYREYSYFRERGIKTPNPRQMFFTELSKEINVLQGNCNAIIVIYILNLTFLSIIYFRDWGI